MEGGDEHNIEDEEDQATGIVLDDVPSIVFGSNAVTTLSPIIVGEPSLAKSIEDFRISMEHSHSPNATDYRQGVQSLSRLPYGVCVQSIVDIVNRGKDAPDSIDLRVVPIDLRNDQEYREDGAGKSEGGDQRVGGHIKDLESLWVGDALKDLLGEIIELWYVR